MQYITSNEQETFNFAKQYAQKLKGGEVIGLVGELGAGKTIFVKGSVAGLGIKRTITSPTFVLMKVYPVNKKGSQIKNFVHVDVYRIKKLEDLNTIGIEEYFSKKDTVVIIEWADKIKRILPKTAKFIKILHQTNNYRLIEF